MDKTELSLDEIIKKHKKKPNISRQLKPQNQAKRVLRILDARSKIIQKNRAKIVDARSKLSVKDARAKISAKQIPVHKKEFNIKRSQHGISLGSNKAKKLSHQHFLGGEIEEFYPADLDNFQMKTVPLLKRTVQNDLAFAKSSFSMPPLPNFNQRDDEHYSDPFDCYVVPTRQAVSVPKVCTIIK